VYAVPSANFVEDIVMGIVASQPGDGSSAHAPLDVDVNTSFTGDGCSTRWRTIALKVPDLWNRIHLVQRQFLLGALQQFDWDISVFWGTRAQQHLAR
jgi:hypothetical protein